MDQTPQDFIDLTVLNTPKPQAASTVERKNFRREPSNNNVNHKNETKEIPTRDTDQSNASETANGNSSGISSVSSLGLLSLANIEDIQEYLASKKFYEETPRVQVQRNSTINEKLELQRMLAAKAIERIDSKSKANPTGLPAYLLQPSVQTPGRSNTMSTVTPTKNESTINLSDFERSNPKLSNASDKINFESEEISARSSSLSNKSDLENLVDISSPSLGRGLSSDFSAKCKSIYERIRQSDISLAQLCDRNSKLGIHTEPLGQLSLPEIDTIDISSSSESSGVSWSAGMQDSLYNKLENELFTPGELAMEKLMKDEESWRRTNDVMPLGSNNKEHLNLSCFSGFIGDGDISVNSKHEKVSMSGFFKERSEDVDDLALKASPQKKHRPLPLISVNDSTIMEDNQNKENASSDQSILSISKIADAVSKMNVNDTPSRVLEVLMKKVPSKPPRTSLYHQGEKNTTPDTLTQSKHEDVLRDTTNIQSDGKNSSVIEISSSSDGDWVDAKPSGEINGTISSITESPSYSCSELEFSEEDTSNGRRQTDICPDAAAEDWIQVEPHGQPIKACIYVGANVPLHISSKTNHWIFVKLSVKSVTCDTFAEKIADVRLTGEQSLLKSHASEKLHFNVMCLVTGRIALLMQLEVSDMVTKQQRVFEHRVQIDAERIKISMTSEILDFGVCAETAIKQKKLTISNQSCVSIPLIFEILQDVEWVFLFANDEKDEHDTANIEKENIKRLHSLPIGGELKILIDMCAPKIDTTNSSDILSLNGTLQLALNDKIQKCLNRVQLIGKVGLTKVQFKTSCMPFVLLPGQTKSLQVRNSGMIDLDLAVVLADEQDVSKTKECFTCDRQNIVLKPSQVGTLYVAFNPRDASFSSPIRSRIRLEVHRGPNFVLPVEGRFDGKSPEIKSPSPKLRSPNVRSPNVHSPNLRSPNLHSSNGRSPNASPRNTRLMGSTSGRSSSSQSTESTGTLSYLQDGKLPIESTKTELVWGCVKPGKNVPQEFLLRNRCTQKVRLQAVIEGTSFKFVKDNADNGSHMSILLRSSESRTVSVNFCPNSKGVAKGRLFFFPYEQDVSTTKRQMIQLFGYGGHVCVDVQKVAKDTSGRMWLSFGRLDYRETLQQTFILRNTGSLAAFACLSVSCKVLYPFMDSNVKISPTDLVIEPNKEVEVCVNFTPRPEDFKYIQKTGAIEVSEIASIKILSGPEPTRARIRRLFNKMNTGSQNSVNSSLMAQLSTNFLVPRLSGTFENERIPLDVSKCKESSSALRDLLRDIDTRDLILTVERDMDGECAAIDNPADDTCMFQSLVCANGTVNDTTLTTTGRVSGGFCTVEPRKITLSPPLEPHGSLLVRSHHSRPMPYEVCVTQEADDAGVQVSPQVGVLGAGDVALLTVTATRVLPRSPYNCMLMVYVENEVMEIDVKILNAHVRRSNK